MHLANKLAKSFSLSLSLDAAEFGNQFYILTLCTVQKYRNTTDTMMVVVVGGLIKEFSQVQVRWRSRIHPNTSVVFLQVAIWWPVTELTSDEAQLLV